MIKRYNNNRKRDNTKGDKKMKFEKMMDEVIKMYGFEDFRTIEFCKLCEEAEKNDGYLDAYVEGFFVGLTKG